MGFSILQTAFLLWSATSRGHNLLYNQKTAFSRPLAKIGIKAQAWTGLLHLFCFFKDLFAFFVIPTVPLLAIWIDFFKLAFRLA